MLTWVAFFASCGACFVAGLCLGISMGIARGGHPHRPELHWHRSHGRAR